VHPEEVGLGDRRDRSGIRHIDVSAESPVDPGECSVTVGVIGINGAVGIVGHENDAFLVGRDAANGGRARKIEEGRWGLGQGRRIPSGDGIILPGRGDPENKPVRDGQTDRGSGSGKGRRNRRI